MGHPKFITCEGRAVASLEEAEGHQHLAGGHGGGCEQYFSLSAAGVRTPGISVYFKYKILRSDAFFGSENGHYQCSYQDPYTLGETKTVGRGCRMKPEGSKIEAEDAIDLVFVGEGTATPTS